MFQPCLDQILICLIRSLIYYSCNTSKADLTHMFWSCTKLRQFWFSIFEILNSAFNLGIQPNPIMALFGVTGDDIHITKDKENALAFATLIARRRILLEWKSPIPPKLSLWLSDVMFFLKTEKFKYFLRGSTRAFYKTWDPLIIYIEKNILLQL